MDKKQHKSKSNGSAESFSTKNSNRDHSSHSGGSSVSVGSSTNNHRQQPESGRHTASKQVDSKSLFDDVSESSSSSGIYKMSLHKEDDTTWRAAKRGDLMTLKRFHSEGDIDWAAPDEYGKIPLYYACHSGAIVDINVVHFLLWVTPIKGAEDLDKCKNKKNKAVMKILDDFERRGYKTPMQFESKGEGMYKSHFKHATPRPKKNDEQSPVLEDSRRPPRHKTASTNERANDTETSTLSTGNRKKGIKEGVVQDSMLKSIIEDVNNIQVTPSNVTNMDTDEWSLGSMFSFGKKLRRKNSSSRDRSHFSDEASVASSRTGSIKAKDFMLRRKVSFDNMPARKRQTSHHEVRRSPRDKVCHRNETLEDGIQPRIVYDEINHLWMIENHIAMEDATATTVVLTIHVFDASQKVIVRNCHGVSVDIHGQQMKSLSIEDCSDMNLVFNSVAHACNIVHCKSIAAETTGVCPKFCMDRVKGVTVWLSRQSRDVSNIVTSKCTEVSVLLPSDKSGNDYERQELALPEKYVHQFAGGKVMSRVSSQA
ncbi:MAG: hypothetical protein SGILL_006604 [Bacillariaceae sp.]